MKKKCEGLLPSAMRRLHELEDENGRLKKIAADLSHADYSDTEFAISNLSSSIGERFAVSFDRGIDLRDVSPGRLSNGPEVRGG